MAMEKNKVKFGLNKVHYAKITSYDEEGVPTFAKPVRIPGAVSLSIDAEGEASNFYADDGVYYVINNNSGYTGDLEIALVPLVSAVAPVMTEYVVSCEGIPKAVISLFETFAVLETCPVPSIVIL